MRVGAVPLGVFCKPTDLTAQTRRILNRDPKGYMCVITYLPAYAPELDPVENIGQFLGKEAPSAIKSTAAMTPLRQL